MNFEERLIEKVKLHDFFYNPNSEHYRNPIIRDNTWLQIAAELERPVEQCKQRWKSLRDKFVKEKHKLEIPSGIADDCDPAWEYYSKLKFLNNYLHKRKQHRLYKSYTSQTELKSERTVDGASREGFNFDDESLSQDGADPLGDETVEYLMKPETGDSYQSQEMRGFDINDFATMPDSKPIQFRRIPCPRKGSTGPRTPSAREIAQKRLRRIENHIAHERRMHLIKLEIEKNKLLVERKKLLVENKRLELLELQIEQAKEAHEEQMKQSRNNESNSEFGAY